MKANHKETSGPDFTDEELTVYGDFADALRDGKAPDIEEYMKRAPASGVRLRKLLEAEKSLCAELAKLRAAHPGVDLARLLEPNWRGRRK